MLRSSAFKRLQYYLHLHPKSVTQFKNSQLNIKSALQAKNNKAFRSFRFNKVLSTSENFYNKWKFNWFHNKPVIFGFAASVSFSFFSKNDSSDPKETIILTLKKAKLADIRQQFGKANEFYHEALALVINLEQDQIWSHKKVLQAKNYIHDAMANMAMHCGHYDDAEKLFKETLRGILSIGKSSNDNAVIEISLKLAMILAIKGRHEEAETGYKYCIDTLSSRLELDVQHANNSDNSQLADVHTSVLHSDKFNEQIEDNAGTHNLNKFNENEDVKQIELVVKSKPETQGAVQSGVEGGAAGEVELVEMEERRNSLALLGLCVDSYARYLTTRGLHRQAVTQLERALHLARAVFTSEHSAAGAAAADHPQIAVLHNDLAAVLLELGSMDAALDHARQAVSVARAAHSVDLPLCLLNLGTVRRGRGEMDEARAAYREALRLAQTALHNDQTQRDSSLQERDVTETNKHVTKMAAEALASEAEANVADS